MNVNNQISADIQFIGSCIQELKLLNNIIALNNDDKRTFGIDINVHDIDDQDKDNALIGLVDLGVSIKVASKNKKKTKMDIVIQGCFKSTNPKLSKDDFEGMLYVNGGSALYSFARSLVYSLSANMYQSGKLLLPMVNIIELLKEKVANAERQTAEKAKQISENSNKKNDN